MTSLLRKNLYLIYVCVVACSAPCMPARAQQSRSSIVMGELRLPGTAVRTGLTIDMEMAAGGDRVFRAYVRPDGSFEIRDVPMGTWQISVVDPRGDVLWHELRPVGPGATRLVIEVERENREPLGTGTVSVTRLRQKPSPAALRELKLADKASGKGRLSESIDHLRRAVELAPDLQDARNNLGAKYLQSGDYGAAQRELQAAVALDPNAPVPHANLALALLSAGRTDEAAAEARLALRRDPLSAGANFAAGAALAQQGHLTEAFRFLERAADRVPQSLLIEARILLAQSQKTEAAAKLRTFLSRPGVPQRTEVTRWLNAILADTAR